MNLFVWKTNSVFRTTEMLSKQGIRWPVLHDLIAGSDVDSSKFRTILKKQEMLTQLHGYVIGQA